MTVPPPDAVYTLWRTEVPVMTDDGRPGTRVEQLRSGDDVWLRVQACGPVRDPRKGARARTASARVRGVVGRSARVTGGSACLGDQKRSTVPALNCGTRFVFWKPSWVSASLLPDTTPAATFRLSPKLRATITSRPPRPRAPTAMSKFAV